MSHLVFIMFYNNWNWVSIQSDSFWKQHDWVSSVFAASTEAIFGVRASSHCNMIRLHCLVHMCRFPLQEQVEIRKQCLLSYSISGGNKLLNWTQNCISGAEAAKADELIRMPVLAQFGPGVETRLPTCSGQILNMFAGPELLSDWPVWLVACSIIGLEGMLL